MPSITSQSDTILRKHKSAIQAAVDAFIQLGTELSEQHEQGTLPPEWVVFEHGETQFTNKVTGQIIELELDRIDPFAEINPARFEQFVKTSNQFPTVKRLLEHDSFDTSCRMLKIVRKF